MKRISTNFSKKTGKVKPMHATNNIPEVGSVREPDVKGQSFIDAGIPFVRLHDSAFYEGYDGEYLVDVHRVFPNFDADENDPNSYFFEPTDIYLKAVESLGSKVFYRLGASIEHGYKKGTIPPKDYLKWAKICEHIILHYTEGWANGFNMDIEYWEIWNEFDCRNSDGSCPTWQGTVKEFANFFGVTAKYLKDRFPNKKIGGPAICSIWQTEIMDEFFEELVKYDLKLDFVSYHRYDDTVEGFIDTIHESNRYFDKYGFSNCEKILNEWNYIRGWLGDDWRYSITTEKNYKGAAFLAGVMLASQHEDLDMLMYYDVRPGTMNAFYKYDDGSLLPPYYSFKAFNNLYKLKNSCETLIDGDYIYAVSASNDNEHGIMISFFDDKEKEKSTVVNLQLSGMKDGEKVANIYLIDDKKNLELVKSKKIKDNSKNLKIKLKQYSVCYVEIK